LKFRNTFGLSRMLSKGVAMSMGPSQQLLDEAVRAHGHLGPFLVIGLRMGLLGKKLCNGVTRECKVEVIDRKPPLCAVDGLKVALGGARLQVKSGSSVSAVFKVQSGKSVIVKVRPKVLERYRNVAWERCEEAAEEVLHSTDEDLFEC
jgi:formylmethanofuran dehydrogenase subunit E